jgi:hypothetical protein
VLAVVNAATCGGSIAGEGIVTLSSKDDARKLGRSRASINATMRDNHVMRDRRRYLENNNGNFDGICCDEIG